MDTMLSKKEIGDHLHIGRDKVNRLIKIKGFPKIQIGKSVIIPQLEYEKWIKENLNTMLQI